MVGMGNVSVVITSYNQNEMIRETVDSVRRQTLRPDAIIVVDDGSTDPASVHVLGELEQADDITVVRQGNAGPSAARDVGIRAARTDYVTVLDGDDRLLPTFLETTVGLLDGDASAVAASGWLRTFGVLDAVVKSTGGTIADFLSRNACPATFTFRRSVWEACGGYDESMRSWASRPRRSPGSTCGSARSANTPRCWRASPTRAPSWPRPHTATAAWPPPSACVR